MYVRLCVRTYIAVIVYLCALHNAFDACRMQGFAVVGGTSTAVARSSHIFNAVICGFMLEIYFASPAFVYVHMHYALPVVCFFLCRLPAF